MSETEARRKIVKLYDWIRRERRYYFDLWETTIDDYMKAYYGEKTSTYTTIKLYMEKYMGDLIMDEKLQEKKKHGL